MDRQLYHLEVILKIVENCNLNCSYCYMYNRGSDIWKNGPAIIRNDTVNELARFLEEAVVTYGVKNLQIDLHGGEPLLVKKSKFDEICQTLSERLSGHCDLRFALQTNGVLVDDDWIELFEKHQIYVSVSLDGPQHFNDSVRQDKNNNGTYDEAVAGLRRLQTAYEAGRVPLWPGVLCVVHPEHDGRVVYRHLVGDLNVKGMDFLLPDYHHGECDGEFVHKLDKYLEAVFDEWVSDDDPNVQIRLFVTQMKFLLGSGPRLIGFGAEVDFAFAFTVTAGGDIYVDDTLRSTVHDIFTPIGNVSRSNFEEVLNSRQVQMLKSLSSNLPAACEACVWGAACSGGRAVNRFSKHNGFENPSVFCSALRGMYSRNVGYLVRSGMDMQEIQKNLKIAV